jgi:hypothetical protein
LQRGPDIILENRGMLRGDLGSSPNWFIGVVAFIIGLLLIFGTNSLDIGLIASGIGLIFIGVREKPKLSFRWLNYTGPPALALIVVGLLLFMHVI